MARSITVFVPESDYEWYRDALERIAADNITDKEAGQRGAKASKFIQMVLTAYIHDVQSTNEAIQKIKAIANKHYP